MLFKFDIFPKRRTRENYRATDTGVFIRGSLCSSVNPAQHATTLSVNLQKPDSVTEAIVTAVADAEGTSPLKLQPLATVIDPDALGALVRTGEDMTAEFTYHGYHVCVSGDGQVTVND
jgi:hypothetical protein